MGLCQQKCTCELDTWYLLKSQNVHFRSRTIQKYSIWDAACLSKQLDRGRFAPLASCLEKHRAWRALQHVQSVFRPRSCCSSLDTCPCHQIHYYNGLHFGIEWYTHGFLFELEREAIWTRLLST